MDKIKIFDIENAKNKTLHLNISEEIPEANAKVNATLDFISLDELINVKGNIKAYVKLTCDLCLNEYQRDLDFSIDEYYAKNQIYDDTKQEVEIKDGQFVTDLYGSTEIDIYDLLYQSVILELPNKKVCGINCKGDSFEKEDSIKVHDNRMDIFKEITIISNK